VNYKNLVPQEFDLKEDLFTLSTSAHPYFSSKNISEIKKHYSNGLSQYAEKIKVEIVTDLKKCQSLWNEFSPKKSLFDTWNFRYAFHKHLKTKPYFLAIKKDSVFQAVLPLHHDEKQHFYGWYGTNWQEDNSFFTKDKALIPLLLLLAPKSLYLYAIKKDSIEGVPSFLKFTKDDPKFVLDLTKINSLEEFLGNLKKKKRYNLKRDKKRIEKLSPKIILNNFSDYKKMVELCNMRSALFFILVFFILNQFLLKSVIYKIKCQMNQIYMILWII